MGTPAFSAKALAAASQAADHPTRKDRTMTDSADKTKVAYPDHIVIDELKNGGSVVRAMHDGYVLYNRAFDDPEEARIRASEVIKLKFALPEFRDF